MSKEDLIPFNKRTPEDRKRIAAMGGRASSIARRGSLTMAELLDVFLNSPADKKSKEILTQLGIPPELQTKKMQPLAAVWSRACAGDVEAIKFLRDTCGEKPTERTQAVISNITGYDLSNIPERELKQIADRLQGIDRSICINEGAAIPEKKEGVSPE